MFKYFVSYAVYEGEDIQYIVSGEIETKGPIIGIADIREIEEKTSKTIGAGCAVSVINWQRFENPLFADYEEGK